MKLKTFIGIYVLFFLLSSCATMTHSTSQNIFVTSKTDSTLVCVNYDTSQIYYLPATIKIDRSNRDVTLIAIRDSIQRKVLLETNIPGRFWLGNMTFPIIGHFVDKILAKEKLYALPKQITIDLNDTTLHYPFTEIRKYCDMEKGVVRLSAGLPVGNYIYLPKGNYHVSRMGFKGFNLGLDYFYSENRLISIGTGQSATSISPIGAYDLSFIHSSRYFSLSYGFNTNKAIYQIGVQHSRTKQVYPYLLGYNVPMLFVASGYAFSEVQSYGINMSANFRIGSEAFFGINYQPSFFNIYKGNTQFGYGNTIFMNLSYTPEIYRPTRYKQIKNGNNKYTYQK